MSETNALHDTEVTSPQAEPLPAAPSIADAELNASELESRAGGGLGTANHNQAVVSGAGPGKALGIPAPLAAKSASQAIKNKPDRNENAACVVTVRQLVLECCRGTLGQIVGPWRRADKKMQRYWPCRRLIAQVELEGRNNMSKTNDLRAAEIEQLEAEMAASTVIGRLPVKWTPLSRPVVSGSLGKRPFG